MIDMEKSSSAAYAAAGVDITAGYKGVTLAASAASLLPILPG